MTDRQGDLIKGLFVGGLIGVALGILFAPKSGKETREELARKADDFLMKTKEEYEKAVEKSKAAYEASLQHLKEYEEMAKEKASIAEGKITEMVQKGSEAIDHQKTRIKKAFDAGLEAYREESNKEKG